MESEVEEHGGTTGSATYVVKCQSALQDVDGQGVVARTFPVTLCGDIIFTSSDRILTTSGSINREEEVDEAIEDFKEAHWTSEHVKAVDACDAEIVAAIVDHGEWLITPGRFLVTLVHDDHSE